MMTLQPRHSLLRGGLFVLWGGWGERKRERAVYDAAPSIFSIIAIFIGIPSGSLCGEERKRHVSSKRQKKRWEKNICGWTGLRFYHALTVLKQRQMEGNGC